MHFFFFFLNKFIYFIYLFLAVLGLRCCARAFSSCGERGPLLVAVCGPLVAVASLVAEHGLQAHRRQQLWLTGSGAQARQLWHTGLVAPRHAGSSRTRARTRVPCTGRRTPNHCTTREACISCKEEFLALNRHISTDLRGRNQGSFTCERTVDSVLTERGRERNAEFSETESQIPRDDQRCGCFSSAVTKAIKPNKAERNAHHRNLQHSSWYQTWNPGCCPCEEPTQSKDWWWAKPSPGRGLSGTACGLDPLLHEDCVRTALGPSGTACQILGK